MEIIEFDEIDSTNDYLKKYYEKYNDFTVVRTIKQTHGRGRFDSVWESKNDLIFSILFKKDSPHHLVAPLSINHVLRKYGFNSCIKWPNDILVDNKKVSGILIEKVFVGKQINVIVGIGINIEKRHDYAYLNNINPKELLIEILNVYKKYCEYDDELLKKEYMCNCSIFNSNVSYDNTNYKVIDMLSNGELILENDEKTITVDFNKKDYKSLLNK